jgi:hypothetical protein
VAWPLPAHPIVQAVSFEADQAAVVLPDPGMAVVPIVAVHEAQVLWGKIVVGGVPVAAARRLPSMPRALPAVLGPERVTALGDRPDSASALLLDSRHITLGDGYAPAAV